MTHITVQNVYDILVCHTVRILSITTFRRQILKKKNVQGVLRG